MLNIVETTRPDLLHIQVIGKLGASDFVKLRPALERMATANNKFALLFDMREFEGWSLKGMWEDFRTDSDYNRKVRKTAMVGDKRWQEWMTKLSAPFADGEIKYFERDEMPRAHIWLAETTNGD